MYVVTRKIAKRTDYLKALCPDWGTACIGDIKQAMSFFSKDEAERQAKRAQETCRNVDGIVDPCIVQFSVKEL